MKGRWWIGVTAGVALGLGAVVATEAATDEASAQRPVTVSAQQLKINQRISVAAVKRSNDALGRVAALQGSLLMAASSGAVGSNLIPAQSRGAVSSQRVDEGNYRVRFVRDVSACTWTASPSAATPPIPDAHSVRLALDTTDASKAQLVVRTFTAQGNAVNSAFHVQVIC
ncbi:hypothetical protein [Miltoncostaea marina]|uniref:hypothetical protein n=1 Tax=Miltoncostaea marina TaxID=2843215 RepID=UPI001C3E7ABF|nr:hypothetical protein [Miltoncostaea marina]